jgi:hypothetical protein
MRHRTNRMKGRYRCRDKALAVHSGSLIREPPS